MNEIKTKFPCPFCRCADHLVAYESDSGPAGMWVECRECGARGPQCDSFSDALQEWEEGGRNLTRILAAAHNFYVTVKPWLHHETDFLKATIEDLRHELARLEPDGKYHY